MSDAGQCSIISAHPPDSVGASISRALFAPSAEMSAASQPSRVQPRKKRSMQKARSAAQRSYRFSATLCCTGAMLCIGAQVQTSPGPARV